MVVTLQGNPALLPPLAKGLKIFAPKKRTDWGLGVSPREPCKKAALLWAPDPDRNLSLVRGCPLRGDGNSKDFCINICLCREKVLPLHP